MTVSFLYSAEGNIVGSVGINRDITERKKEERTMIQIRTAVDSASDAIAVADANGDIIYQNQGFLDLFCYTAEVIRKMEIPSFYQDSEMIKGLFERIKGGERWNGEAQIRLKDGSSVLCLLRANPIVDEKGKLIGFFGVHTDISERKQMREALLRFGCPLFRTPKCCSECVYK